MTDFTHSKKDGSDRFPQHDKHNTSSRAEVWNAPAAEGHGS